MTNHRMWIRPHRSAWRHSTSESTASRKLAASSISVDAKSPMHSLRLAELLDAERGAVSVSNITFATLRVPFSRPLLHLYENRVMDLNRSEYNAPTSNKS
jgi:hypothetical protein